MQSENDLSVSETDHLSVLSFFFLPKNKTKQITQLLSTEVSSFKSSMPFFKTKC